MRKDPKIEGGTAENKKRPGMGGYVPIPGHQSRLLGECQGDAEGVRREHALVYSQNIYG